MTGIYLKFYVQEKTRHHGVLLYDWLLKTAQQRGLHGGSAIRALAGFGRHGVMHEEHFFELAGNVSVEVSFIVEAEAAQGFLDHLAGEGLSLFYVKLPVEFGVTGSA